MQNFPDLVDLTTLMYELLFLLSFKLEWWHNRKIWCPSIGVFEIPIELENLPNFPNCSVKLKTVVVAKCLPWSWLLNFIDLTIHFYCPLYLLILVLCIIEAFNWEILLSLLWKNPQSLLLTHPWNGFAQYKNDPKVKAVRLNGQINEVKQSGPRPTGGGRLWGNSKWEPDET